MLTTEPGPDVEPYHDRQIVVLQPGDWAHWLYLMKPESELLRPLEAGAASKRCGPAATADRKIRLLGKHRNLFNLRTLRWKSATT